MVMCNIHDLLERCFADGFTVEHLSRATDIPVELINRCHRNGTLSPEDLHTLNYLLLFLTQLYVVNTDEESYLKNIVETLTCYFEIAFSTIAKYLNLDDKQLSIFLDDPESFSNSYSITKKLIHLFTTLIRDQRHST